MTEFDLIPTEGVAVGHTELAQLKDVIERAEACALRAKAARTVHAADSKWQVSYAMPLGHKLWSDSLGHALEPAHALRHNERAFTLDDFFDALAHWRQQATPMTAIGRPVLQCVDAVSRIEPQRRL